MKKFLLPIFSIVAIFFNLITPCKGVTINMNDTNARIYDLKGFENVVSFDDNYSKVCKNGKCGLLRKTSYGLKPLRLVTNVIFDDIQPLKQMSYGAYFDFFKVSQNNKWGILSIEYISKDTYELKFSKIIYDDINEYGTSLLVVNINSKKGLYHGIRQKEIAPTKYDDFRETFVGRNNFFGFDNYIIEGKTNGKWEKVHSFKFYLQTTY